VSQHTVMNTIQQASWRLDCILWQQVFQSDTWYESTDTVPRVHHYHSNHTTNGQLTAWWPQFWQKNSRTFKYLFQTIPVAFYQKSI